MMTVTDQRGADDLPDVVAAQGGDGQAFAALFDRWFDRVFDVALRIVRNRDTAAEVAQDVFLTAWQQLGSLQDPHAFGGWILRMGRNRALNRLERDRRSVVLGDEETTMEIDRRTSATDSPDVGERIESDEAGELLWAAAAALGERDASLLDLHLRHGLTAAEMADELGVTDNNAHQLMFRLRARLGSAVRGFVLWRDGAPACADLADVLRAGGVTRFGADAARITSRHAFGCAECKERQRLRLSPEAMFAAIPIAVAGSVLKAKAAAALELAGVPISAPGTLATPPPEHLPAPEVAAPDADAPDADVPDEVPDAPDEPVEHDEHDDDHHDDGGRGGGIGGGEVDAASAAESEPESRRKRVVVAVLVAAIVILIALTAVLADPLGHGTANVATVDTAVTTTTAASTTSTTASTTTTDTTVVTTTTAAPRTTATTARPATTAPATTPTTSGSPAIGSFAADPGTVACLDSTLRRLILKWSSTNATQATIEGEGAPAGTLPPSGSTGVCAPTAPVTYVLTVTGPGGSASQPLTVR